VTLAVAFAVAPAVSPYAPLTAGFVRVREKPCVNLTDYFVKMTGIMHDFTLFNGKINTHIAAIDFQDQRAVNAPEKTG
jgi:hypothetical protein